MNSHDDLSVVDPLVQALITARREQKLTQAQLAELAGLSRRAVILIEAGNDTSLSTLRKLGQALGVDFSAHAYLAPTLEDMERENEALFERRPGPWP